MMIEKVLLCIGQKKTKLKNLVFFVQTWIYFLKINRYWWSIKPPRTIYFPVQSED